MTFFLLINVKMPEKTPEFLDIFILEILCSAELSMKKFNSLGAKAHFLFCSDLFASILGIVHDTCYEEVIDTSAAYI